MRWKNAPQNAAPIAGADYQLCPASPTTGQCVSGAKASANVTDLRDVRVPKPGDWTLKLWLRDAAGNARPESAAPPVHLRFDPDPPALGFRPLDLEDPSRVAVAAVDATSGVARGEIELRRRGARTWRALPTQLDASGFAAALDDEHMRDGSYELRARAWDAAGNERSTDRRTSGEPATLLLPVRIKTRMRVGKPVKRRIRGEHGRRRYRAVYLRRPVLDQGRRVRLRGRVTMPGNNPLAGAGVEVASRLAVTGSAFQPVAALSTSRTGRFSFVVPRGAGRVLRFRFAGSPKVRPQTREVEVRVRAASSIGADRSRVVNGEAVTFSGRLRGAFLPPEGKLVELQFSDRQVADLPHVPRRSFERSLELQLPVRWHPRHAALPVPCEDSEGERLSLHRGPVAPGRGDGTRTLKEATCEGFEID